MNVTQEQIVRHFLHYTTNRIPLDLNIVNPQEWGEFAGVRTHHLGWAPPEFYDDDLMSLVVCPERMVDVLGVYVDETIEDFLDLVDYINARYIIHYNEQNKWNRIEEDVYSFRPDALHFLSEIEFEALDVR